MCDVKVKCHCFVLTLQTYKIKLNKLHFHNLFYGIKRLLSDINLKSPIKSTLNNGF
jgi:hypothetical protein